MKSTVITRSDFANNRKRISYTYVQRIDNRYRRDRCTDRTHALIELVFGLVCADDGPGGPVIDHLLVGFSGAGGGLRNQGVLLVDS